MPRIKKITTTDEPEIQPLIPQEGDVSIITPISPVDQKAIVKKQKSTEKPDKKVSPDIQAPVAKMTKEDFKQLHIKDTYWLENDIYQTITDMTEGKKIPKTSIINQALKDYIKKNKIEIKPFKAKIKKS